MKTIQSEALMRSENPMLAAYRGDNFNLRAGVEDPTQIYKDAGRGLSLNGSPIPVLYQERYGEPMDINVEGVTSNIDTLIKEELGLNDAEYGDFRQRYSQDTYTPIKNAHDNSLMMIAFDEALAPLGNALRIDYALKNGESERVIDLFRDDADTIRVRNINHYTSMTDGHEKVHPFDVTVSSDTTYNPETGFFLDLNSVSITSESRPHETLMEKLILGDIAARPFSLALIAGSFYDKDHSPNFIEMDADECRALANDINERLVKINGLTLPDQPPKQRPRSVSSGENPSGLKQKPESRWEKFWHKSSPPKPVAKPKLSPGMKKFNEVKENLEDGYLRTIKTLFANITNDCHHIAQDHEGTPEVDFFNKSSNIDLGFWKILNAENIPFKDKTTILDKFIELVTARQKALQLMNEGADFSHALADYAELSSDLVETLGQFSEEWATIFESERYINDEWEIIPNSGSDVGSSGSSSDVGSSGNSSDDEPSPPSSPFGR